MNLPVIRLTTPLLVAAVLAAGCSSSAEPSLGSIELDAPNGQATEPIAPPPLPAPPQVSARGFILVDQTSEATLAASNENERLEPASLTKLMTAYAVFHALKDGRIALDDQVTISRHARAQEGSRMFIEAGSQVTVENLIQGMIVQSGNDATVALAEHVAGSEGVFVDLMNRYAGQLGMANTHFMNSPGLPDPEHYTTARDMALLASAVIREFPEYYRWYSQRAFTWNGITQPNRNGLLDRDASVDGVKTGYTASAGYCLVSSAERDGMRLISVVMGARSAHAREDASQALLNYGFNFYETRRLFAAGQPLKTVPVWKGDVDMVDLALAEDLVVTLPRGRAEQVQATLEVADPILAPLDRGAPVGRLHLTMGDETIASRSVVPLANVAEAGLLERMADSVRMWLR